MVIMGEVAGLLMCAFTKAGTFALYSVELKQGFR